MREFLFRILILTAFFGSFIGPVKAGAILDGDPADGMVVEDVVDYGVYDHLYTYAIGALYNTDSSSMVEGYALPYLAPGQQVTNATISFYLESLNGTPAYNLQLYGLKRVTTTSGVPLPTDEYTGANNTANTLLDAKFVTPTTAVGQYVSYTGANLASFIQSQYGNATFSGMDMTANRYIFFRLNPDNSQDGYNNYLFANARNPNRGFHPTLALTISNGISNVAGRLQFSFNLPQSAITSAGVYDNTSGKLLRTLWNNVRFAQGTSYGVWDGKDDTGAAVATGTSYQIKLIYHNVKYVFQGMVGNTSASQSGANVYHAFEKIHDLSLSGTSIFFSIGYNEAEALFHYFTVGSPQVCKEPNFGYDFTDSSSCMYYVTSDASRSYWAKTYGGVSAQDTYVIAINNDGSFYTFPKGSVPSGSFQHYASCLDLDTTAYQANAAHGLAVQKTGSYLFVSHDNLNVVRVFDKLQGNLVGSFTVPTPGRMATTANGDVWIVSNGTTPSVMRYTFANGVAKLDQTITGLSNPAGVGVSADDSLVLIADGGASQQLKAYSNSTGASAWTYGTLGGMDTNGPNVTSNVFEFKTQRAGNNDFSNEAAICFQPDNTFWITDGGSSRVLHFSISGNAPVYIEQITFNDTSYRSTVDLTDATRVFNSFLEYSVNYSLPLGGTNGSWKLVKNWAYDLLNDSTHLYYGSANGFSNVVTLSNGRTYGFLENFTNSNFDLFELPATGPLRYTGYTFNNNPRIYEDGTLRFNTSGTNNSSVSYYSMPLTGFDTQNNPVWGSPTLLASSPLAATDPIPWNTYPMRTELTASGVLLDFDGNYVDSGYHLAGVQIGASGSIKWHASPSVHGTASGWFPQDGRFDTGDSVQYAGNHVMAMGRNIVYGYNGEFWGGGQASQWVNFLDNGLMVGLFGTYEGAGSLGSSTVDGFAGNAVSPTLVRGPDGNVYLYHNDECNHGGTNRWLISGWDGVAEINAVGTIGSTTSMGADTQGPAVSITSPPAGATYVNGSNIVLSASAAGTGANLASVQFFDGTTSLGIITVAPYTLDYSGLSVGTHVITAQATDVNGAVTTSGAVTITIGGDGLSAPPPAPISLGVGTLAAQIVALHWSQPTIGTTSSTVGQIISFQCDAPTDSNALTPTMVAGAPGYAVADFNLLGQVPTGGFVYGNVLNSLGKSVTNVGQSLQMFAVSDTWSLQSLTGTAVKLFTGEISTANNTGTAVTINNIPFASYDVMVYSQPDYISFGGTETASVTVGDGAYKSSVVSQSFTKLMTGYAVSTTAFGTSASVSNSNSVLVQGLSAPLVELQGPNLAGFQIIERPYDQGVPTSYSIERATGTSGTFAAVGTTTGTSLSFTDSTAAGGTAYQYRIKAINSYGSSAYSNVINVTTPSVVTNTAPPSSFSSWQSKYFTAAQLADATISGPNEDPYGSSIPNLLAYALQLNPATANATDVPTPTVVNGHLSITYFVPTAITDINYIVEVSSDLNTWNTGTGYTTVTANVTTSTGHTITVQDTLPTTTPKHFMHLRVTQH